MKPVLVSTHERNREYFKQWRQRNPNYRAPGAAQSILKWKSKNPDYFRKYSLKRYWDNPERARRQAIESRDRRKKDRVRLEKHKEWSNGYQRRRKQESPQVKIACLIRRRILLALKTANYKSAPTEELIGCSFAFFCSHIESLWLPGMTWENHGKGEGKWHIDHIRPCASFDLQLPSQQKACFNFSNTQPLWELDNYKKGSKCEPV